MIVDPLSFNFDFDVEVFQKSGEGGERDRRIGGFVSTDDMDQQGEKLIQSGLDFEHFLTKGWFNDNHSKDTAGIVGWPETATLVEKNGKRGWYVEGHLLKGHKRADDLWELANALQKSSRRLGFSVEGKILERQDGGSTVSRALVKNVAITNCAVNDKTSLNILAKSMDALNKALAVGPAFAPGGPGAAPGGDAVPGIGGAILPQSITGYSPGKRKKRKNRHLNPLSAQGGLTKSAALSFILARRPNLSIAHATSIFDAAAKGEKR